MAKLGLLSVDLFIAYEAHNFLCSVVFCGAPRGCHESLAVAALEEDGADRAARALRLVVEQQVLKIHVYRSV